jgi:hypothetical protein
MKKAVPVFLLLLIASSCSYKNIIDQTKFQNLFRAARAVEMISLNEPLAVQQKYSKEFEVECAVGWGLAKTDAERKMVGTFQAASNSAKLAIGYYASFLPRIKSVLGKTDRDFIQALEFREQARSLIFEGCQWYEAGKITAKNPSTK